MIVRIAVCGFSGLLGLVGYALMLWLPVKDAPILPSPTPAPKCPKWVQKLGDLGLIIEVGAGHLLGEQTEKKRLLRRFLRQNDVHPNLAMRVQQQVHDL
eukprot:3023960-Amphidinium_carterae.1